MDVFIDAKPFYGKVTNHSFILKANSRFLATSYYVKGEYVEYNNITKLSYTMEINKLLYFATRFGGIVMILFMIGVFVANDSYNYRAMATIGSILLGVTLVFIFIDIELGRRLEREFIELMDIAPNSKEG